jgi:hypothetical protein
MKQLNTQKELLAAIVLEYQQNQRAKKHLERMARLREIKLVVLSAGFGLMFGQCQLSGILAQHVARLFGMGK